jgi:hypothetical protein
MNRFARWRVDGWSAALRLMNPGLDPRLARRVAMRKVANELGLNQRRQVTPSRPGSTFASSDPRHSLLDKLSRIFDRHIATEEHRDEFSRRRENLREPRSHLDDPAPFGGPPHSNVVIRKVADRTSTIGVWGSGPTGAQLLGDEEFAPAMHSITTRNWRASLELNERVERERREAWAERKLVLKAKGVLQ